MQPSSHIPPHGNTTARIGTQRATTGTVRRSGSRTIRNTPIATSQPYLPSHTETHDVPDSSLITSVNLVAVQSGLNVKADIERHIGYNNGGRWFCTRCNEKSDKRKHRIWDHVANCLGYEIYRCTGECGKATWCVLCPLAEHGQHQMLTTTLQSSQMQNA